MSETLLNQVPPFQTIPAASRIVNYSPQYLRLLADVGAFGSSAYKSAGTWIVDVRVVRAYFQQQRRERAQ